MASWPENPRLIGTRIPRLDGLAKASGEPSIRPTSGPRGRFSG